MEAFESLCERLLRQAGYWTIPGIYVGLEQVKKDELDQEIALPLLGRTIFKSFPRTQIDLVAYKPKNNELLIIECKSYLDSSGISMAGFPFDRASQPTIPASKKDVERFKQYKLFQHPEYFAAVADQLIDDLRSAGMLTETPTVRLVLICGKLGDSSSGPIRKAFKEKEWRFVGPKVIVRGLTRLKNLGYHNDPIVMTAKLLLR